MNDRAYKASFFTLGCRLNQAETSLISDTFQRRGYELVDYREPTDVCVINTCTVTEQADAKCRQLVRQVLRRSPHAFVAVVGCYSQVDARALSDIEGVDLILGNEEKMRVSDFIDVPQKFPEPVIRNGRISREPFTISSVGNYEHATRANLKIQDGCDFMCSFCIIPFARGRSRSRAFWDVQREAIELVERGHKELVLTGVNVGTYEFEGKGVLDVVQMLERIPGLQRLRISSIEPTTIPEALVYHMARSDKLCNHFHIPLQHSNDRVLADMKRLYSKKEYREFIDFVMQTVPDVCLGTDVMVGFPGESQQEFEEMQHFLKTLPFAYFHVFPFSERGGTPAVKLRNHVSEEAKKTRSKALRNLSQAKRQAFYGEQAGKSTRVLLEERNDAGHFQGYTDNYVKVAVATDKNLENELVDVTLTGLDGTGTVQGVITPNLN